MKSANLGLFLLLMALSVGRLCLAANTSPIDAISELIQKTPDDPRLYVQRAQLYSSAGKHSEAISDLDAAIKLRPDDVSAVDFRGSERLLAGQFDESIRDFDTYLAKQPHQAPYHWKRGIALYYAGRFDDGVKQFDIHQTVNSADVENAVWRFLCMAKRDGVKAATNDLLKIGPDSRIPMSEVYKLFAGTATVDDVLSTAKAGDPDDDELRVRLFYAHLYIGLYLDAIGKPDEAVKHLKLAAEDYLVDHYMGGIAVVHLAELQKNLRKDTP